MMMQRIAVISASLISGIVLALAASPALSKEELNSPHYSESTSTHLIHIEHGHNNDTVDPRLLEAWNAYRNGDFDTAALRYSEVLRQDVRNHSTPDRDALLGMAAVAQQRSQDALAARYYSQILAIDPRDPDAQAGMSSLRDVGGAAEVESNLKRMITRRPEAAAPYFALGNHYAERSRWADAEQAYFSACALEPDNARYAFNLAVSLDHLGQDKLAIPHYRQALRLDQANSPGFDHAQTQLRLEKLLSTNHE